MGGNILSPECIESMEVDPSWLTESTQEWERMTSFIDSDRLKEMGCREEHGTGNKAEMEIEAEDSGDGSGDEHRERGRMALG